LVWVGSDLKDHLVPTPLPPAETPSTRPVPQSPIQPGLEHLQAGGIHKFSGQYTLKELYFYSILNITMLLNNFLSFDHHLNKFIAFRRRGEYSSELVQTTKTA